MRTNKKYKSIYILLLCFILLMSNSNAIEAFTEAPATDIPATELPALSEQPALYDTPSPLSESAVEISKIQVTSIEQIADLTKPIFITTNDTNDFNNKINDLKTKLKTVTGITDIDTQVSLTLDTLSTDSIPLNESGKYKIIAEFKIDSTLEDTQNYYLSKNAVIMKIPVYILDQDNFNFYDIVETDETIEFVWKNTPFAEYPFELYFKASNNPESSFYNFFHTVQIPDSALAELQKNHLIVKKNALKTDTNYYFFVENRYYYSNILHIQTDGSSVQYNFISTALLAEYFVSLVSTSSAPEGAAILAKFEEPDIIQAPPDEASVINTSVSASDLKQDNIKTRRLKKQTSKIVPRASEPVVPLEEVTDTKTKISGTRLNYMLQIYPDYVPFEHQGILLRIPAEFLKNLGIAETSYLTVEIKKDGDFSFSIIITVDGEEITDIPSAQIQFPITTDSNLSLYYNNHLTDTVVTYENNMAIFEIHSTGSYKLEALTEEVSPSANVVMSSLNSGNEPFIHTENIVFVIIGILFFIGFILISLYRRRKEYQ